MKILVYGAGALGQAIGCMLSAQGGHHVDFILRERFIGGIVAGGLKVTGILGEFCATPQNCSFLPTVELAHGVYDYVLITTKAYDTETAVRDITRLGDRAGRVVSMQNGCGNVELVEQHFGPERSLGARVITGFEIVRPGVIAVTVTADAIHVGASRRGDVPDSARELAAMLARAGHPALAVPDIHQSLFAKLLYNCSLNPLGAILGVHYGALAERAETRELMNRVIDETFAVIAALGGTTPWPDAAAYRQVFYDKLVPATYNHRPSMLQDLENGKRTEVDALVGYVSRQGKRHGLSTGTCDVLAALVKFKESQGRVG